MEPSGLSEVLQEFTDLSFLRFQDIDPLLLPERDKFSAVSIYEKLCNIRLYYNKMSVDAMNAGKLNRSRGFVDGDRMVQRQGSFSMFGFLCYVCILPQRCISAESPALTRNYRNAARNHLFGAAHSRIAVYK